MSEQNILNPDAASEFNPDYGYSEGLPQMQSLFQAESGETVSRQTLGAGRTFDLAWKARLFTTKWALDQWEKQYRNGFFSYYDIDAGRYYSGRFVAPLKFTPQGNDKVDISGQFVELPKKAMYAYPNNWDRDAIIVGVVDDDLLPQVKLTGVSWTFGSDVSYKGGNAYWSNSADDVVEWLYWGYGFRVWSGKNDIMGIAEVAIDGVVDGTFDAYDPGSVSPVVVYTKTDMALGFHRVKLRVTGDKNPASADIFLYAEAIEVMQ